MSLSCNKFYPGNEPIRAAVRYLQRQLCTEMGLHWINRSVLYLDLLHADAEREGEGDDDEEVADGREHGAAAVAAGIAPVVTALLHRGRVDAT